ncbi:MAG TPA: endonuclease/exonuclease/phosphatase family protein [Flavobacteriales bacterium]
MEALVWSQRLVAVLLLVAVGLPLLRSDHWTVRILDYPRSQKLVLVAGCLLAGLFSPAPSTVDHVLQGLLVLALIYLCWLVRPYTPLARPMLQRVRPHEDERTLHLLVCNVLQHNRAYARMAALIAERDPDVVFLLETDAEWQQGIAPAVAHLEHRIAVPLANTYGLLFCSRFPIERHQVRYLIDEEVPSIVADLRYGDRTIRLHGLHPTPPVPQENPESTERDAEVLLVGREAKECPYPVIVMGDLNDVAWSHTTRLFLRISGLLDPRRGRGMFSTFHARFPLFRWPLDHFFVSGHFRLVDMRVERQVGSDHLPIALSLVLRSEDERKAMKPDASDLQEATEKIAEGQESGDAVN